MFKIRHYTSFIFRKFDRKKYINTGADVGAKALLASAQPITAKGISRSNGLVLLIVKRIADMHGATVTTNETPCKDGREVIISFTDYLTA